MGTNREWIPNREIADSALAVEAALPDLRRLSRRWYQVLIRVLGGLSSPAGSQGTLANKQGGGPTYFQYAGGAAGMAGDLARDMRDQRLAPLKFAVSELADDLSAAERQRLREHGELPAWFLPKAQERAKLIRKQLR